MASFGDEVAELWLSGAPRAQLRELCRDWKRVRTPYSVTHAIVNAAEDGRGRELHEALLDDDFQDLRQQMSGADGLRDDIRAGLDYFSGREPDLLKYLQVMFLEQSRSDQGLLAAHQQHCQGFADFLQLDLLPHERHPAGLHGVLQRFFPVRDPAPRLASVIDLAGYELGTWRCSCGALTGMAARYGFSCPCGTVHGTGRLAHGMAACTTCAASPSYTPCPACGTRVTLENLWKLREGNAHPSVYQVPLVLRLIVRDHGQDAETARLPLMMLPIPLGTREREGSIVFGLPDLLWLGDALTWPGESSTSPTVGHFVGLGASLRYDGRTELRKIFEAMVRRTLLKYPHNSYRKFGDYIAGRLWDGQRSAPDYSLTRSFRQRIGERLADRSGTDEDMLRFIELSADCTVAASPALRAGAALVSTQFGSSPLLSVPHLFNLHTELDDGASLTARPPGGGANYVALLDASGLARPGQTVQPGQALAGISRPVTRYGQLTGEERLLHAVFGSEARVRRYRDTSACMPGGRPGRLLAQHVTLCSPAAEAVPPAPGRIVQRDGPAGITMTVVVDRPLEVGDTLLDGTTGGGAAVICGIRSAWELSHVAGTSSAPDLVVAPDHPWAPPAGAGTRRIRVHLSKADPAATDMTYRDLGNYHPVTGQPARGLGPYGTPALLTQREFRFLISRQARGLALELYGPRSDCRAWRRQLHRSLAGWRTPPAGTPLAQWTSLSDSPSGAVLEWERLLRCARIRSRVWQGQICLQLMTDAEVLELSHGKVKFMELFPDGSRRAGLFSERIFGPLWDRECACGKYSGLLPASEATCDECGVDLVSRDVRRDRMGHIELPAAVVHSWFLRGAPQKRLADLLKISTEELTQIARCTRYVVADPGTTSLRRGQILPEGTRAFEYEHGFSGEARLAVGGDAIEILLRQADDSREPDLTADRVVFRKLPVLPPDLRTDINADLSYRYSDLNRHYSVLLHQSTVDPPQSDQVLLDWRARLQSNVDALFGCAFALPENRTPNGRDGTLASIADRLCRQVTVRGHFLARSVDFSARAMLVASDTGDAGTALLPAKVMWALLRSAIARALAGAGTASGPDDAWVLAGMRTPRTRSAFDQAAAQALVLIALPAGPWPLVAMRVRPAGDQAVHLHPQLLDHVGWDNLGQTVKIFSVLTDGAAYEAERLLIPARLLERTISEEPDQPPGNSIFDLTRDNLTGTLASAAWTGTPFPLAPDDSLLLCAADWTAG
jgi:RNA polymerase Rpb1, domain 1/RNA polymerase Rpb2, domain 6